MLRIVWRAGFVCLALGSLVTGAAVLGLLGSSDLEAEESKRVRLLVKCEREELTNVLAALAETKAEIWDLATMKRVKAVPAEPETPPAPKQPVVVPPLRNAGKLMEEILTAVASVPPAGKASAPQVTEMVIQQQRAYFKLSAASSGDIDRVRKALEASTWLQARSVRIETGAAQRQGATLRQHLQLKLDASEPGQAVSVQQLDATAFARAVRTHRLTYMFAGAVRKDPNRKAGYVTTTREYTFQAAKLDQLRAFLVDVANVQPGLVPLEVRWKDNGVGMLLKPVIRVGGRAPTP